ncbi:MAG TPA: class I SAM-dependent methyltransferase [Tepidiformaceae bacterium]|nr:class I SAM-dependent methyltransferase [Tepidiformaceae bacterium]
MQRPRYKTWVRTRPLVILSTLTLVFASVSLLFVVHWVFLVALIPAAIFAYMVAIVGLSKWRLGPGGYQARIHQLLVERTTAGRILDIGCGSGHLLSKVARAHPNATLVGLDYWGDNWEYSRELCIANFRAEGLEGRAEFIRGTASSLPADLGTFDTVLSCMTFHEVRDTAAKTVSLRQALSHVAPGGRFAFIDPFADQNYYPNPGAIAAAITESGATITELARLQTLLPLPFPLKHTRVLGHTVLISGTKNTIR